MHFPEAVHLGQSDASQLVSVQLLDRKISRWLIRQSCSDVQLTELLIQAPSGQFVHHLHCRAGCVGLENVLGCLARHSLQVLSLRHWSG